MTNSRAKKWTVAVLSWFFMTAMILLLLEGAARLCFPSPSLSAALSFCGAGNSFFFPSL